MRYAVVVAIVLLATLLRGALAAALGEGVPFILYFPAVVACAWFGGLWPGLLATALAAVVAGYAFMAPYDSFALASPTSVFQLALFLLAGALISLLAESLHRARRVAVERPRQAYEDARRRQREAESLAAVARTINTLDLGAVLQNVVESACALLEADLATVFRLDPTGTSLALVAAGGPRGTVLDRNVSLPRGSSLVWLAVEQRETVTSPDLLADRRFTYPATMRAGIEAARHRAGLAAPLVVQGRIIGALFVGVLPGRTFSADDVRLVTAFADHAAAAMANAELYDDAQRTNRAKDEFLAMLGHELRNPLGAIAGASGVLKATGTGDATAERARAVIDRQVQHLARLVDDLLDVGRLTTGKVRLNRHVLELGELVSGAMGAWRASGRFSRHDVRVDVSPVWVDADETRMEQVVGNLVVNALKYTPPAGRVTVRVAPDGDSAVLEVADTGAGIPPGLGERIFDLFVQGERPLDRGQGGLGIGLTLVKALVALHGGTVEARSEGPGRGSAFTVRVPAVPAPAGRAPAAWSTSSARTPRRILVVEDNADAREMLRVQLTLAGHEVHEAVDGPAGVEAVNTTSPDVALIDVGLPGLDGYEVARRIRAGEKGASLVLIAVTGYGQAEDRMRAEEAGFDAHLTKPLSPERLDAAMQEAAARRERTARG